MTQARSDSKTEREGGLNVTGEAVAGASGVRARPAAVGALIATGLVVVGIDQLTKQLALSGLSDGSVVKLLGGLMYLDLTRNSGAAFSIGSNVTFIFPLVAFVVLGGVIWLARTLRSVPWALAMGLIVGGAFGNLLDRLLRAPGPMRGHVVDFLSAFKPAGEAFPIFNAADSALFCGVVLAIFLEFTGRRRDGTRVLEGAGKSGAGQSGAGKGDGAGERDGA